MKNRLLRSFVFAVCLLALPLAAGCGKTGEPRPLDPNQSFTITNRSGKIVNNCLAIRGTLEGAYSNMDRMRLEIGPLTGGPDDCIGCPFVPQEVVFVNAGDIGLTAETGEFGFSYCPQQANGYRWRLAGINKHTTFPHSVSKEKITMK